MPSIFGQILSSRPGIGCGLGLVVFTVYQHFPRPHFDHLSTCDMLISKHVFTNNICLSLLELVSDFVC